jgi:hypothetical protein
MDPKTISLAAALLGLACFAGLWYAMGYLVARTTGWKRLADAFPAGAREPRGENWRFQCLRFNKWGNYNNCVTIAADPEGLHLRMWWPFSNGHAPVFIPWREIARASEERRLLWRGIAFEMAKLPGLKVAVGGRVAEALHRGYPLRLVS